MIKLTFCLHRLPHLSRDEFQTYWRENHAPLVAKHAKTLGIARYVQVHALTHDFNGVMRDSRDAPDMYDGIAEIYFESWDALFEAGQNEGNAEAGAALLEDERKFIDLPRSPLWFNEEHVIIG
ncbi:MAG TPA: EthD family reductase [Henriciella marina]|uniref:EthD domain-containing protein n=1 Tax=Henriciella sp. TaxID=1968823 RepID=UPI0018009310|nr:EthD domain-containing protein [Henriciella sp.]HIG21009.1 EthD family reductase [Henriciella sp.]HIK64202.1 EthD family reductase [Henriciella marina]